LLRSVVDDRGATKWELNPVVDASRKSSEAVIRAMQILSNIVDGQKNLNVNVDVDAIKNVWEKRKNANK
jgi:hypothetical protein